MSHDHGNGGPVDAVVVSNMDPALLRSVEQSPHKLYVIVSHNDADLKVVPYTNGVDAIDLYGGQAANDDDRTYVIGVLPPRVSKVHRLARMGGLNPYPLVADGHLVPAQRDGVVTFSYDFLGVRPVAYGDEFTNLGYVLETTSTTCTVQLDLTFLAENTFA